MYGNGDDCQSEVGQLGRRSLVCTGGRHECLNRCKFSGKKSGLGEEYGRFGIRVFAKTNE